MTMRDIQTELRGRLKLAKVKKRRMDDDYARQKAALDARFRKKAASIEGEIAAIRSLLEIENRRVADNHSVPSGADSAHQGSFPEDDEGERSEDED